MDGARRIHADVVSERPASDGTEARKSVSDQTDASANPATAGQKTGALVIGIPTLGRAEILTPTVRALAAQSRLPDRVILSVTGPEDYSPNLAASVPFAVDVVEGSKGLCAQRNRILDTLEPDDTVLFLDDDFLLAPDYLDTLERLFVEHPDIAMLTGKVIADGVVGPGYSHEYGARLLHSGLSKASDMQTEIRDTWNGYGCNFAFRAADVAKHNLRFDETLPFYGWLEDVDFSGQLEPHGRICEATALRGVHLGVKVARSPGRRLGYSQVVNPIYLYRKSTMRFEHARELVVRNIASNLVYSLRPRPWADSRGRLVGNLIALWDLARGRAEPERIREL